MPQNICIKIIGASHREHIIVIPLLNTGIAVFIINPNFSDSSLVFLHHKFGKWIMYKNIHHIERPG